MIRDRASQTKRALPQIPLTPFDELLAGPSSPHGAASGSRGKPVGAEYQLKEWNRPLRARYQAGARRAPRGGQAGQH